MKVSSVLVVAVGALAGLAFSMQAKAQSQGGAKVELKDLGVPATQNVPNRVSGPLPAKPSTVPTVSERINSQYQQSQSTPGATIITKPNTHPNESNVGVGVSVPINGSGITPSGGSRGSRQ